MNTKHDAHATIVRDPDIIEKATQPMLDTIHDWVAEHSVTLLRTSMGAIIFGYGILKYFPGVSPAENLVQTTVDTLTLGQVPSNVALIFVATLECVIGLSLMIGRGFRVTIYLLGFWLMGVLSPVILLPHRLFGGPAHAPTLEGQYVLKDIIFLTASLVIATTVRRRDNAATLLAGPDKPTFGSVSAGPPDREAQ